MEMLVRIYLKSFGVIHKSMELEYKARLVASMPHCLSQSVAEHAMVDACCSWIRAALQALHAREKHALYLSTGDVVQLIRPRLALTIFVLSPEETEKHKSYVSLTNYQHTTKQY